MAVAAALAAAAQIVDRHRHRFHRHRRVADRLLVHEPGLALGEGAGLVERDRLEPARAFEMDATLDEDAAPRYRWSIRDSFSYDGFAAA